MRAICIGLPEKCSSENAADNILPWARLQNATISNSARTFSVNLKRDMLCKLDPKESSFLEKQLGTTGSLRGRVTKLPSHGSGADVFHQRPFLQRTNVSQAEIQARDVPTSIAHDIYPTPPHESPAIKSRKLGREVAGPADQNRGTAGREARGTSTILTSSVSKRNRAGHFR